MIVRLEFLGEPKAKQSARFAIKNGRIMSFQNQKVKNNADSLAIQAYNQLNEGWKPIETEIHVMHLLFVFPFKKTLTKFEKEIIKSGDKLYKKSKPDIDNLIKATMDPLNNILFKDDSQIVSYNNVEKVYGDIPKTILVIEY